MADTHAKTSEDAKKKYAKALENPALAPLLEPAATV